jgi:hypothetical protein
MKRRRLRGQSDSLDLLLDTICNAFGGIIFIAVLVAMLVREGESGPDPAIAEADTAMTGRAIAGARNEIARYEVLIAGHGNNLGPITEMSKTIGELEKQLGELQPPPAGPEDTPATPAVIAIREKDKPDRDLFEVLTRREGELEKNIGDLKSGAETLTSSIAAANAKHTETLRFPKENPNTSRRPYFVFVRDHAIYAEFSVSHDVADTTRFTIEEVAGVRKTILPIDGKGTPLTNGGNASLETQLRAVDRTKSFLFILLYPDSYDTWRDFRRLVIKAGLEDYGIGFQPQNQPLILVSHGAPILPQGGN